MTRQFGPYDIFRELGRGAMGEVSLAVHRSLQRKCALKTIALKFHNPSAAGRFIREGQAIARLGKHPHIVQVFDAGIVDETPYIAMEFVEGETLDCLAKRRGPFGQMELVELGRKIGLALDHAHRLGIIHRDVKPANIIIDPEGEPHLLDFGIAKAFHVEADTISSVSPMAPPDHSRPALPGIISVTEATLIVPEDASTPDLEAGIQGTPAFMAPEQADPRRGPVDARSDIYSLGATLYVLATGRHPFEAETITELLVRVITELPAPPSALASINPDLDAVILKSLEKDPDTRYQTALEFADDLSRVIMGLPTRARKLGWLARMIRTHKRLIGIAAAFLVFAGVLFGYFQYRSREIQALWEDIAERTSRATAQEVRSLLDPALPMLEECSSLAEAGLMPVDEQDLLASHLIARFRYQKKLSWLSYGDAQGRFTGAWRHPTGRIVIHKSWLDAEGGHVREAFVDGDREPLRWNDEWTYDPRTRPFYLLAAATIGPVWTKPYEWFGDEGLGITSALALREPDSDAVRGVFTADYHLGALADFLANLKLGKQGRAYLLRQDGSLLASPERGALGPDALLSAAIQNFEARSLSKIQELPSDEPRSYSFRHDGRAYVAAIESFQPSEGLPVITVVLVPEEDIIGSLKASSWRTAEVLAGIALCAVVVSVAAGVVRKRRLIQVLSHRKPNPPPPSASVDLPEQATLVNSERSSTRALSGHGGLE